MNHITARTLVVYQSKIFDYLLEIEIVVQEILIDVIISDFLKPTIDRLSEQLYRNIWLPVTLMLDKEKVDRLISTTVNKFFKDMHGDDRIVASDIEFDDTPSKWRLPQD